MDLDDNPDQVQEVALQTDSWLSRNIDRFGIGWLLGILTALHLFVINYPNQSGQYVFDEAYYIPYAHDLLTGVASNIEHPFLGKAWVALGEMITSALGAGYNNTFFPRLIEVGFGIGALYLFYTLCQRWLTKHQSLFATAMLGFDTLFFVHTSLALLDGPPLFFTFAAMLFYFWWRDNQNENYLMMSGLLFGLAILSKETAVLFVVIIAFYHLASTNHLTLKFKSMVKYMLVITILVIGALTVYDIAYSPTVIFPSGNAVALHYGWQNIEYMASYQSALHLSGAAATDPWHYALGWINPLTVQPDPYYVTTVSLGSKVIGHPIDWQGIGNLALWYSIYPLVGYLLYKCVRVLRRKPVAVDAQGATSLPSDTPKRVVSTNDLALLVGLWVMVEYGADLFTSYVVHRIVYAFYMLDLTPALVLGVTLLIGAVSKTPQDKRLLYVMFLVEAVVWFFLYFPIHPWLN